jgi:hypothetical protein
MMASASRLFMIEPGRQSVAGLVGIGFKPFLIGARA